MSARFRGKLDKEHHFPRCVDTIVYANIMNIGPNLARFSETCYRPTTEIRRGVVICLCSLHANTTLLNNAGTDRKVINLPDGTVDGSHTMVEP